MNEQQISELLSTKKTSKDEEERLERYNQEISKAFSYYDKYIAYQWSDTGVELVLLKGRYKDLPAIKIPIVKDDRNNILKRDLEKNLNIKINKFLFKSDFTMPYIDGKRYKRTFNVYSYSPMMVN